MDNFLKIVVFSVDLVFIGIIKRMIENNNKHCHCEILSSFSEAGTISPVNSFDLIIVDDLIIGMSCYELISFLRLNQKIITPIIYFGVAEYDGVLKAHSSGANHFIVKPFRFSEVQVKLQGFLSKVESL
jgi:DNA-binding response OmpR family regulator